MGSSPKTAGQFSIPGTNFPSLIVASLHLLLASCFGVEPFSHFSCVERTTRLSVEITTNQCLGTTTSQYLDQQQDSVLVSCSWILMDSFQYQPASIHFKVDFNDGYCNYSILIDPVKFRDAKLDHVMVNPRKFLPWNLHELLCHILWHYGHERTGLYCYHDIQQRILAFQYHILHEVAPLQYTSIDAASFSMGVKQYLWNKEEPLIIRFFIPSHFSPVKLHVTSTLESTYQNKLLSWKQTIQSVRQQQQSDHNSIAPLEYNYILFKVDFGHGLLQSEHISLSAF